LAQWIRDSNITLNGIDLIRTETELSKKIYYNGVHGMVATRNLERAEVVLRVPQHLVLTTDAAFADPDLGPILQNYTLRVNGLGTDTRAPLAIFLLWIKNNPNSAAGRRWGPYVESLPKSSEMHSPLFWSRQERTELQGTFVLDRTLADLEGITGEYVSIFTNTLFKDHPAVFNIEKYPLADYVWAWVTQWSRAVDYEEEQLIPVEPSPEDDDDEDDDDDDDEEDQEYLLNRVWKRYLIPIVDQFNHPLVDQALALKGQSADEVIRLPYSAMIKKVDNDFVLLINNSYTQGEEVFRPYVPKAEVVPNIDLLRKFGFIDPSNSVQVTVMKLGLDKGDQDFMIKETWANAFDVPLLPYPYCNYYVGTRGVPSTVASLLRIANYGEMTDDHRNNPGSLPDPHNLITQKNEQAMWDNFKLAIDLRLRKFRHTEEDDMKLLDDAKLPIRKQLAVEMRSEERNALNNAQTQLQVKKIKIGNVHDGEGSGTTKFSNPPLNPTVRSINRGRDTAVAISGEQQEQQQQSS
jgi:hypothetical protein